MLFSVIIPIYNAEKTLDRCLKSVQDQEFSDFEVIMVDDGSSDKSRQIAERYAETDVRFCYYYQENSGVSSARNLGISKAQAEYVTFLDSDDIYYRTYLSGFAEEIKEYPGYGHYWCAFEEIDENGNGNGKIYRCEASEAVTLSGRDSIITLHRKILVSSPWNKVYRRSILQGLKMRPDLSLGEDEFFNFEYLDRAPDTRIVIDNTPRYGYFAGSQESLNTKYREDLPEIYEKLNQAEEACISKWGLSEAEQDAFSKLCFFRYEKVLWNFFHEKSRMHKREKYRFAASILRSKEFRRCLKAVAGELNPLIFRAYSLGSFWLVVLLSRLAQLKNKG